MAAVEHALGYGIEQAEGGHHGAGWKNFDLEVAAGHVVDLLGVIECVFVKNVLRRPGALPAHADRALRADDGRRGDGGGGAGRGHFQEAAPGRGLVLGWSRHGFLPVLRSILGGWPVFLLAKTKGSRAGLATMFAGDATLLRGRHSER